MGMSHGLGAAGASIALSLPLLYRGCLCVFCALANRVFPSLKACRPRKVFRPGQAKSRSTHVRDVHSLVTRPVLCPALDIANRTPFQTLASRSYARPPAHPHPRTPHPQDLWRHVRSLILGRGGRRRSHTLLGALGQLVRRWIGGHALWLARPRHLVQEADVVDQALPCLCVCVLCLCVCARAHKHSHIHYMHTHTCTCMSV